jgi:hypothetical protein
VKNKKDKNKKDKKEHNRKIPNGILAGSWLRAIFLL